ncbi:MAG: hypothetical protein KA984_05805 [Candidatus Cloacimonetes bacterium]|nr:hypothetical protein [Candidatus Cloacimonadota bacterium]
MKRMLLCALLMLMAMSLFAQKGLFELSFGDSLAHCDSLMNAIEMQTTDKEGLTYLYYPLPDSRYHNIISRIVLYLDKDTSKLKGWVAYLYYPKTGDLEAEILSKMKSLHGDEYQVSKDDYYGGRTIYTWKLSDSYYVQIGPSGDVFHVWYDTK